MKQHEAVIKVMKENGGYATLSYLYENVPVSDWKTKTPYASIRRIVQKRPEIFRIKPGLWALKEDKDQLPEEISALIEKKETKKTAEYSHTYFQGLLAEIGILKGMESYVPNQDRNRMFLGRKLGEVSSLNRIYEFGYKHIVERAKTVDVVWFNNRKMPFGFFEVEHSTNFQNSLIKFVEFQDFCAKFYIVSDAVRKREFEKKVERVAFEPIRDRIRFIDYKKVASWHTRTYEQYLIEKDIFR